MKFCIQASAPRTTGIFNAEDETLDEAIETTFFLNSEMALINWSGVFIPLSYKYSISTILADVLLMLQTILENNHETLELTWPSSDFNSRWVMSWKDDYLKIDAKWESVIGNTEEILNSLDSIEIGKTEFLNEWKMLLEVILNGLDTCGYDESTIKEISIMQSVYSNIETYGILYKD